VVFPIGFQRFFRYPPLVSIKQIGKYEPDSTIELKKATLWKVPTSAMLFRFLKMEICCHRRGERTELFAVPGLQVPPFRHGVFICGPSSAALHFEYIFRIFLGGACNFVSGFAFV